MTQIAFSATFLSARTRSINTKELAAFLLHSLLDGFLILRVLWTNSVEALGSFPDAHVFSSSKE